MPKFAVHAAPTGHFFTMVDAFSKEDAINKVATTPDAFEWVAVDIEPGDALKAEQDTDGTWQQAFDDADDDDEDDDDGAEDEAFDTEADND